MHRWKMAARRLPPSSRETWRALAAAVGGVCLVCLLLVAKDGTFFWKNDFQTWYTPIYDDMVRAWRGGEWPILTPYSWSAGNLGGEYQAGTFSLWHAAVLRVLWSLPLSAAGKAAALAIIHLSLLAAGVVMLLRQRGARAEVAAAGALSVALSGWIVTWGAAQWFVALGGFAWLPWAWWAMQKALSTSSGRVRWALPAPFAYLLISAGSPFSTVMLAIVTAWLAGRTWATTRDWKSVAPLAWAGVLGVALSTPAWWMLLEMSAYSTRREWGMTPQFEWLVSWRAWLGALLPSVRVEWVDFFKIAAPRNCAVLLGALVPLAAGLALSARHRWHTGRASRRPYPGETWDLALFRFMAVLCMVPLVGSFRWSFRWLPLFQLALAVAGAEALRRLAPLRVARVAAVLVAVAVVLALATGTLGDWRFAAAEIAIVLAWWFLAARGVRWSAAAAVAALSLAGFALLDLQESSFAYTYPFRTNLERTAPLDPRRLYVAVYSWGDVIGVLRGPPGSGAVLRIGNTALCGGVHFLNGYSSFFPLGVPSWFAGEGNVISDEQAATIASPRAEPVFALLGVDGLVFSPQYRTLAENLGPEWQLVHRSDEASVYHRDPPRAAVAHPLDVLGTDPPTPLSRPTLTVLHDGRQEVKLRVEPQSSAPHSREEIADLGLIEPAVSTAAPSAIAFSRPYLPGYEARWNGRPRPVDNYHGVPLVALPQGAAGELILRFRPPSLRFGIPVAVGAFVLWGLVLAWPRRRASTRM
ncbi:MAG TPA: hypothetical protein VGO11_20520 [Chthoniobacteraceae bacterium]|jgi:hypothetical protein|nr:hypothetical protein [Chthoniobacteraceae bacterium]